MSRPTVKDLARESGWSLGTVSRVLNQVSGVSEQARREVLEAAGRLGYRRNEHAAALSARHPAGILLMVRAAWIPVYESLVRTLEKSLLFQNESVRIVRVSPLEDETEKAIELIKAEPPRLLLLFGARRESLRRYFGRISVPAISVGADMRDLPFSNLSTVYFPDTEMMQQAAEILFERGRKKIGLILGDRFDSTELADRFLGVQYAFYSRRRVLQAKKQTACSSVSFEGGYKAMNQLLESSPDLDGLIVFNELQAAGALRAAADHKRRIPEDLEVLSVDESGLGQFLIPRLSALKIEPEDLLGQIEKQIDRILREPVLDSFHEAASWKMEWAESCPNFLQKSPFDPADCPAQSKKPETPAL